MKEIRGKAEVILGSTRGRQDSFCLKMPKNLFLFLSPSSLAPTTPPCVSRLPKFGLMLLSIVEPAKPLTQVNFEVPVQMTDEPEAL